MFLWCRVLIKVGMSRPTLCFVVRRLVIRLSLMCWQTLGLAWFSRVSPRFVSIASRVLASRFTRPTASCRITLARASARAPVPRHLV